MIPVLALRRMLLVAAAVLATDRPSLEPDALPPGLDKAGVLDALKGGKALGAASLVLRFNH